MFKTIRSVFLAALFIFPIGPPAFAQAQEGVKILAVDAIQPGTKAVGFSVFRGTEPEPFDIELRGVVFDAFGFPLILIHISGGPMETPLEKIGAVAGMSGSPIFVGDCLDINECIAKTKQFDNDVALVGALSYSPASLVKNGTNALATPAQYMLGLRSSGYNVAKQFPVRPPNKIIVDGVEFKNLMLFSELSGITSLQGASPAGRCPETVKSDLKPGSMITVFLAKGTIEFGGSGTVMWVDGQNIYAFGHPFFGSGRVSYPFTHVSVADTIQTPINPYKIVGCKLETEGAIIVDGAFEISGVIGHPADTLSYVVELHMGQGTAVIKEQVADSPIARAVISQLPVMWARQLIGDTAYLSVAYQTRVEIAEEQGVFVKNLISAHAVGNPFSRVFAQLDSVLNELEGSRFKPVVENIAVHVDIVRGMRAWKVKKSFLSQNVASPGKTVSIGVVLESNDGALSQVNIPVEVPKDFLDRAQPGEPPIIAVVVQSADKFVNKAETIEIYSLADLINKINEEANQSANVLYIQRVVSQGRNGSEGDKNESVSGPFWRWTETDKDAVSRLPNGGKEVLLNTTAELDHYISGVDLNFSIMVRPKVVSSKSDPSKDENKNRKWYLLFLK